MTTKPQPSPGAPITMLSLLHEIFIHCEAERICSLEAVHQLFEDAVRKCSRPTEPSNPSLVFFADWVARKNNLIHSVDGKWQRLSLEFWQIIHELEPNDARAYVKFWKLLTDYCQLDQKIVSSFCCSNDSVSRADGALLRCELIQLCPEPGVYLRCYKVDNAMMLGEHISTLGFFDSSERAKSFAETNLSITASDWVPSSPS